MIEKAQRTADWAGFELNLPATQLLEALAYWLVAEAIPAGGLGPREGPRVWDRHIADSLAFATAWDIAPEEILDVGSGVGLPGLPLAVLWPETTVTLLDRGGRRTRLLNRAVRILGLENVFVAQGDIFDVADEWAGLTFRGSVKPAEAVGLSAKILTLPGTSVLGLSRRSEVPERSRDLIGIGGAMGMAMELQQVPAEVLDGGAWLLIMRTGV